MIMIRATTLLLLGSLVAIYCSTVQAATRVISINFDDGPNTILPGESAGVVPAVNWNNFSNGTFTGSVLMDNSGVTDFGAGANVTMTTVLGTNGANVTPTGGGTGDVKLWTAGTRSVWDGNNDEATQVLLEGLAAAFPNGYDVYIFTGDVAHAFAHPQGSTIYESNTVADYTVARNNSPSAPPAGLTVTDTETWDVNNGEAFDGIYTLGRDYVLFSGKSADDAVYSMHQNHNAGGGTFNWGQYQGMQIVGEFTEAEAVPEPSTYALGLMGLVGFGLFVWRRRRRS